jgi:hypothetical protein
LFIYLRAYSVAQRRIIKLARAKRQTKQTQTHKQKTKQGKAYYLDRRFPNWWVARRFVLGRKRFLKCDFFNYIKVKNHEKWESEKTKQN